ncbi:uncharacterized protein LOC128230601 [Mya arenaria]|uniref:uncharacterized protein LOC128230601 n=1 Tax=Mya arenaria TaxID=6604 RepID=UPI0022E861B6|nr:uncharacterized protein LOC128230601 [Mya arenaria]
MKEKVSCQSGQSLSMADGNQNENNYIRLHLLVMKAGEVLRAKFDSIFPPAKLAYHLKLKTHADILKDLKKRGILSKIQYSKLNQNPDSGEFDTTLLVLLLRSVCNLDPNDTTWEIKENKKIINPTQPDIASIVRIRNLRNEMQHAPVAQLKNNDFEDGWNILKDAMVTLGQSCGMNTLITEIGELRTKSLDLFTPEMKSLRESTLWFLEENCDDDFYVETARFKGAKRLLDQKRIIVLTGHPGEGKTSMAARLALADGTKRKNCLKLNNASDWNKVDWSLPLFTTVIVDDIFGGGALNQKLVHDWIPYIPLMTAAARKGRLKVIITTRHFIKEEALAEMDKITIFNEKDGNVLLLSSLKFLTFKEKKDILESRARKSHSEKMLLDRGIMYDECVRKAEGVMNLLDGKKEDLVFGFPQCATLFVQSEELIRLGSDFFSKPEKHFKTFVDQLYKGEDETQFQKFLALVAVWAEKKMRIKNRDLLNAFMVSDHIKHVAASFGIQISNGFLETLKSSLKSHVQDLLLFIDRSGEYTFSHNVNGDMVGVVLGRHKILECIALCPRDFLMERVTVAQNNDELRVFVPEWCYGDLCEKFAQMIGRKNCNFVIKEPPAHEFQQLQREGPRFNTVDVISDLDFGILKHNAFNDTCFVKKFIGHIQDKQLDKDLFTIPVMKMTGYFLDYGIKMKEMVMFLPGYTLYRGLSVLAKEMIEQEVFPKDQVDPLLLATHSGDIEMMKLLLSHGAKVSGDTIYVAMHAKGKVFEAEKVLETIVEFVGIDINDKGNAVNGNYPLIVAARKGFSNAVKCLLEHGADPKVKNDKKLTALHRAVINQHADIIQLLIDHDAPVNEKGGKFKRSPLHIAADLGMSEIVETFLKCRNVNIKIKDHRGHYPIFLAAIRGYCKTVRVFLKHDKSQDSLRIASYGKGSFIKGMSLFHVAVWKNNRQLIEMLIDERANPNVKDFYGRTPLVYAIITDKKTATRMLLQYSDKTIADKQGNTPLHAAIHKGNIKVVAKLVTEVNVNSVDKYGRTPLHVACEKADVDTAHMLLNECDADPLMVTKRGDTVFHILRPKHENKSHDEQLRRRFIEMLLLEKDPAIFNRVRNMPNRRGVLITDIATLQEADEREIRRLRQGIITDFGEMSDDDDVYDNGGGSGSCGGGDDDDDDNDDDDDDDDWL